MELDWKQKNVLVIGAGVSGFAAAKLARRFGAAVTLSDAKTEDELEKLGDDFSKLRELGVALAFGPQQESLLALALAGRVSAQEFAAREACWGRQQTVTDYVAGLTDSYAVQLFNEIFMPPVGLMVH